MFARPRPPSGLDLVFASLAAALIFVPLAVLLINAAADRARTEVVDAVEPTRVAVDELQLSVLRAGTLWRPLLFALDPGALKRYRAERMLPEDRIARLERLTDGTRLEADAARVIREARATLALTDAGVQATMDGDTARGDELLLALPAQQERLADAARPVTAGVQRREQELSDRIDHLQRVAFTLSAIGSLGGALALFVLLRISALRKGLLARTDRELNRFNSMVEATGFGVLQADERGRVAYANPAVASLFGVEASSMLGQPLAELLHAEAGAADPEHTAPHALIEAIASRQALTGQLTLKEDGESPRTAAFSAAPIPADGAAGGAVVVFEDITERLEEEQRREEFLALAAHELRSPLTSILGFSRLLLRRPGERGALTAESAAEAIATIRSQAERMSSAITLFLDMARLDTGVFAVEPEPASLSRLLHEEVLALRQRYPDALITEDYPDDPVVVVTDEQRLRQVVSNLLDNAVKYGGTPPAVTVRVTSDGQGGASVDVQDNGAGIPEADQLHVFERYYRVRRPEGARREGLGLGLYIASQIVQRLGGSLAFESKPGEGTTFTLRLPPVPVSEAASATGQRSWSLRS